MDEPHLVTEARAELSAIEPDRFVARRAELVKAAKSAGDPVAAKSIGALRKPSRAAWLLNQLAGAEPELIDRLARLATELRHAERSLDGPRLRELSGQRRRLVAEMVGQAVEVADSGPVTGAVQDELAATLNAAVADPQVAAQLQGGVLVKATEWSGFGGPADGPHLSLVPDAAPNVAPDVAESPPEPAAPKKSAADGRGGRAATSDRSAELRAQAAAARERAAANRQRLVEDAERAEAELADADQLVDSADDAVSAEKQLIEDLTAEIEQARTRLKELEVELRTARGNQRLARLAAERARRRADRD